MNTANLAKLGGATLAAAIALAANPVAAQEAGDIQVRLMATAVLPDGNITDVLVDPGLPAGTQTVASDNVVPTVAIDYYFTPNVSVETICCVTQHDVDINAGALAGAEAVANARVIPATFTLKYHMNPGGVSPYVGAGPTYFLWINDAPGAGTVAVLGATRQHLSNELGFALQAGVDVPVGDNFMVSLDAKRYFVGTTASWYNASDTLVLQTEHDIDPWVLSAGVGIRF
ncbi:MAG: outer membrane beta-barrel protein [Erythrobacter sp.]|nr:outer membrane beta-barrel protein [Erythrobacter sp.]